MTTTTTVATAATTTTTTAEHKQCASIVICGHANSGKSTITGRLLYELGGIDERELTMIKQEAAGQTAFELFMDRLKEERERGVLLYRCEEFYTERWHYTIIDAPEHRDFIRNIISGVVQADVALLIVSADTNQKKEDQDHIRQHSRLLYLLGVKQIIVGVNKMDSSSDVQTYQTYQTYQQSHFNEVADEMRNILATVGWTSEFVTDSIPILPISSLLGDNLLNPSTNMPWWTGQMVKNVRNEEIPVVTLLDCLDNFVSPPPLCEDNKPVRVTIVGIYKIKGVGDMLAGRVEQGIVEPNREVVFLPTHTSANNCTGKVVSLEMHHKCVEKAFPGDNIGMKIEDLRKDNMPRCGDVMILKGDTTLNPCKSFKAVVQTWAGDKEEEIIQVGCAPIAFTRCGHSVCRLTKIDWKTSELTQCVFETVRTLVVDPNCDALSRIAFLHKGNTISMFGKITEADDDRDKEE